MRAGLSVLLWGLILAYMAALGLFVLGQFGLFGTPRDPLAGVFLVPLGLPWNRMIDAFPEAAWPWLAALAPLLNILLVALLRRGVSSANTENHR
ncbi:hypothetical protein [Alloyangia pacifica]|uniref:Uncharacterized protein n=1 Tax=Alloyangia pacifica TaxID=311180 RepID=A0A1I6W903_9RHOB|nr:hypothetical protein [Alloyangia pacifica]SDI45897.1 hypothetical protein SAMN04488245_11676 [Alloyangia pacifica]SFT22487.1 hypothetical protein SAMN04488050_11676 [Alloyangia pacifica]